MIAKLRQKLRFAVLIASVAVLGLGILGTSARSHATPQYGYEIVKVYPHDPAAFTQGLEFRDGFLYEGTGLYGRSTLRKEDLETGKILQQIVLPPQYFGEGITVLRQRIFQLTWKSHIGFEYEQNTFLQLKEFGYPGEGWGLANDGREIYMSDGTPQIRCLDPAGFHELRRITVHDSDDEIENLNELEWVRGELYANVWGTNRIARISPSDGTITGWIDASGLLTRQELEAGADVLNGIAYDAATDRLFVTGKLWPKLFQIRLVRKKSAH